MRVLLTSVNLLGDMLNITPSIEEIKKMYEGSTVELRMQDQKFCRVLEDYPGITTKFISGDFDKIRFPDDRGKYDFFHNFDTGRAAPIAVSNNIHISQAFGQEIHLNITDPWPIMPKLEPKEQDPFIAFLPFCGGQARGGDWNTERSPCPELWGKLFDALNKKPYPVKMVGYSRSDWGTLSEYVSSSSFLSIESVKNTIEYLIGPSCKGIISPDSGVLHGISGGVKQIKREHLPTIFFSTEALPTNFSYPYGLPEKSLIVLRAWCGRIKYKQIKTYVEDFKEMLSS